VALTTPVGYPNTIAPGAAYARAQRYAGAELLVADHASLRVTPAAGATRRVAIAPGTASAYALTYDNDAILNYDAIPAPITGTAQWFMVGASHWAGIGNDQSVISHIPASVGAAVPTSLPTFPTNTGTDAFHPLALCLSTTADTAIQQVIDLRTIAGEGGASFYVVHSELAHKILDARVGTMVYRTDNNTFYRRVVDKTGALSWINETRFVNEVLDYTVLEGSNSTKSAATGYQRFSHSFVIRAGKHRHVRVVAKRSGAALTSNAYGVIPASGAVVATVYDEDIPRRHALATVRINGRFPGSGNIVGGLGEILTDGRVVIRTIMPGVTFGGAGTDEPDDSVVVEAEYFVN